MEKSREKERDCEDEEFRLILESSDEDMEQTKSEEVERTKLFDEETIKVSDEIAEETDKIAEERDQIAKETDKIAEVTNEIAEEKGEREKTEDKGGGDGPPDLDPEANVQPDTEEKLTDTEEIRTQKEFVEVNRDKLETISRNSSYAMKKKDLGGSYSEYELMVNAISTSLRLSERGSSENQRRFRETVVKKYKDLNNPKVHKNFPVEEATEILTSALSNTNTSKPKTQLKLSDMFVRKPSDKKKEKTESSTAAGATGLRKTVCEFGSTKCGHFIPNTILAEHLKKKAEVVKVFQSEAETYSRNTTFTKKSNLPDEVAEAKQKIADIEWRLKDADKIQKEAEENVKNKSLPDQMNIIKKASEKSDNIQEDVLRKLSGLDLSKLIKDLKKRNQTRLSNKAQLEKAKEKMNSSRFKNAHLTWQDCLHEIEAGRFVEKNGVKIDEEEAEAIKREIEKNAERFITPEDLLILLDRTENEKKDLLELVVQHLPVVELRREGHCRIYDSRQFLKDPQLMVSLFERSMEYEGIEKKSKFVTCGVEPEMPENRGKRKRGVYKLRQDVVTAVQELLDYAGTPAHVR